MKTATEILGYLERNNIDYIREDHPPVFSCEDAKRYTQDLPGTPVKNLLLRVGKRDAYILLLTPEAQRIDFKILAAELGSSRLSLASADELRCALQVDPGAVSPLAMINDTAHCVTVVVESSVVRAERILCHPLCNTTTISLTWSDVRRYLDLTGHSYRSVSLG